MYCLQTRIFIINTVARRVDLRRLYILNIHRKRFSSNVKRNDISSRVQCKYFFIPFDRKLYVNLMTFYLEQRPARVDRRSLSCTRAHAHTHTFIYIYIVSSGFIPFICGFAVFIAYPLFSFSFIFSPRARIQFATRILNRNLTRRIRRQISIYVLGILYQFRRAYHFCFFFSCFRFPAKRDERIDFTTMFVYYRYYYYFFFFVLPVNTFFA